MKFFTLLKGDLLRATPKKKLIPAEELSTLIDAKELLAQIETEVAEKRVEVAKECDVLREKAQDEGYQAGLAKWNEALFLLEEKRDLVKKEMEKSIVPLAIAAVKRIIGREVEIKPETIVDIIASALKAVTQHKKISLFVCKADLEKVEKERPRLKALFENLQSLTIAARDDVSPSECIVETEGGIIKISLDEQLKALEVAFRTMLGGEK